MKKMFVVVARKKFYAGTQHSYVVGVTNKKQEAIDIGRIETIQRGGKYDCYLLEVKDKRPERGYGQLIETKSSRDFQLLKRSKYKNFLY